MKTYTKTYTPTPRDIERRWYVVDADGAVLGRLASGVASILRGKHKPIFAPHVDVGDHVIVVNARGVRLTGGKEDKKVAYRHSGYPGGLRETVYARLMVERPVYAVEKAIKGMLPKNRLGRAMARKLQVYEGPEHPHRAQKPEPLPLGQVPPWTGIPEPKPKPTPAPKAAPRARAAAAKATRGRRQEGAAPAGPKRPTAKRTTAGRTAAAPKAPARRGAAKPAAPKAAPAGEEKRRRTRRKKEES